MSGNGKLNCGECPYVSTFYSFGSENTFGFFCTITNENIFKIPCDEAEMIACPDIEGKSLNDIGPLYSLYGDEEWDENPLWPERVEFWKQQVLSEQECFQSVDSCASELSYTRSYFDRVVSDFRSSRDELKRLLRHRREIATLKRTLTKEEFDKEYHNEW